MWEAVGIKTHKIYMSGQNKPELLRKLQTKYPSSVKNDQRFSKTEIYPESLRFLEVEK